MPERDANQLAADAAENREWIANWRDGMFSSTSRDAEGWPIEMHGVVASLEQALTDVDELVALVGTLRRDAARERDSANRYSDMLDEQIALVGTLQLLADERARERDETDHSLTHCRGLLEAAESLVGTLQQRSEYATESADHWLAATREANARAEAAEAALHEAQSESVTWQEASGAYCERMVAAEAALATTRQALTIYQTAYAAVLAHAEGLRMDTAEDEAVRLKLVALLNEVADTGGDTKEHAPTDPGRTHTVVFDFCHHLAFLLDEEYGDGSAWCQVCGEFRVYEDAPGGAVT